MLLLWEILKREGSISPSNFDEQLPIILVTWFCTTYPVIVQYFSGFLYVAEGRCGLFPSARG